MKTSVADQQTLAKAFLHITVEVLGNTATDDKEIFLEWKPDSVVGGGGGVVDGKDSVQQEKWEKHSTAVERKSSSTANPDGVF